MLFSVVIPTHNRLDLLSDCIETVRRQDEQEWELVVFDNASSEDIQGYVQRLGDSRIRCVRSEEFLPVTESWNSAIDLARGDFVTFLGDDDGLAPGYFTKLRAILERFERPEVVYCALYQFMHPGVAPWERNGYVAVVRNGFFFVGKDQPFKLSAEQARKAVSGSISLQRNFTFNIQAFVFSKTLLSRLRDEGRVFQSPFPDYYLANVALARSQSTVIVPEPLAMAGVSKASFGYTLFNGLEERGAELLNTKLLSDPLYKVVERHILPGPLYNTNYIVTMEHVVRAIRGFTADRVNFSRYRLLQMFHAVSRATRIRWWETPEGVAPIWNKLGTFEKLISAFMALGLRLAGRFGKRDRLNNFIYSRLKPYGYEPKTDYYDRGNFGRLVEVFESLNKASGRPAAGKAA